MAGDGSIFSFHTTANTPNRDGKPAFQIYTDVMRVFSQENFVFGFQQSKSLLSLRVRWLVRAWLQGPKCARLLQTHCCCCSSSIPRANSRISWHWTLQRGRAWKHTHTTHHFAWITNHQLNDCAHFSGTLLSMWLIRKQWNGTPVCRLHRQTWKIFSGV